MASCWRLALGMLGVQNSVHKRFLSVSGILSQYMMRTILATTALVLVVLLALAGLFEFIAELDDMQGDYQTPRVILYTALAPAAVGI